MFQEICKIKVLIRGAGEMASGIAHRLYRSGFRLCFTETVQPLAVRRRVSFSEAIYDGVSVVEGVTAQLLDKPDSIASCWEQGRIPLLVDPENATKNFIKPDVVVDAIVAKRNLGTAIKDAPLVIGMGPGFTAGQDVHVVIETNRGHNLGRLIFEGEAETNTGVPGTIGGHGAERVLRAPGAGILKTVGSIGSIVSAGEVVAMVEGEIIRAGISGIIRGLLRNGTTVKEGLKVGDVDPRGEEIDCYTISDKARALGGSVLEAILFMLPEKSEA